MKQTLWVEKYRPKTISDVIFQDERQSNKFLEYVKNKQIPNLLLTGVQGTGKTTISRSLIRDLNVDPADVMKINCSDEKIDGLRDKVKSFATTMPNGPFKVVRLEEFDYLSLDAQALLRTLIEDVSSTCRFIATGNYDNKIIPALKSRFDHVHFKSPDKEKVALRAVYILEAENVSYDVDDVISYIDVSYPDIRKLIQLLQGNSSNGKLQPVKDAASSGDDWKLSLFGCLQSGDWRQARKIVCDTCSREEHEDVYRLLYENVEKLKLGNPDDALIILADYLYKHHIVSDTEINIAACFIALSKLKA